MAALGHRVIENTDHQHVVAARRANQLTKLESHSLTGIRAKKPTMSALEEIRDGKLGYQTSDDDEDVFEE